MDLVLDFLADGGVVFVAHIGADVVGEGSTVFLEFFRHDVGGGFLGVFLAAVGDDWEVEEIAGGVGDVVEAPEGLFPGGQGIDFGLAELLVALHIDESGPGVDDGPLIRVMRP